MKIEKVTKGPFTVIGREGSTEDGPGFIRKLWADADAHFGEIAGMVKRDADGDLAGLWGAMSDFTRSFMPWDDFNRGLYLAGAECEDGSEAPEGWTKWIVPGYEYLMAENDSEDAFRDMLRYMEEHGIPLSGAVHDFTCPKTGKNYMMFPVRKL